VPTGPRSRAWRWVAASVAVGAVAAAGGAVARSATGPARPSQAAIVQPATTSTHPVVPPAAVTGPPADVALPAGWVWYNDPTGYRVAVPAGWPLVREGQTAYFCDPHGSRMLEVGPWTRADPDLTVALQRDEAEMEMETKLAGYHRIRIEAAPVGAEWEYTYDDDRRGRLHGLTRGFVAFGQAYLIEWRTPPAEWHSNLANLDVITDSFHSPRPGRQLAF
jgi:hypothetical protein